MKKYVLFLAALLTSSSATLHAVDQYFAGDGSALNAAKYGTSAAGPFTNAFTNTNSWVYDGALAGTGIGGTISVNGMKANQNFTLTAPGGTLTLEGTVTVGSGITLNLGTQNVASVGGLTMAGPGTLILSGTNTSYAGTTTMSGGTLRLTNAGALGTGTATSFTGASSIEVASDSALSFSGTTTIATGIVATIVSDRATAGAGLTHTYAGTRVNLAGSSATLLAKAGTNVTSGMAGVTVGAVVLSSSAGAILKADAGALLTVASVATGNSANSRSFSVDGAGDVTITGNVTTNGTSGNGSLTKSGTGRLTLNGNGTFNGTLLVNAGTVRATANVGALGAGTLSIAGGVLELANDTGLNYGRNTTVTATTTITADRLTAGAGVTDTLGTLSIGAVTLNIAAGANVTSGVAGVNFGAVTLTGNATFSAAINSLLTVASVTGVRNFAVNGSGDTTVTGDITTGTGLITKLGSGTLILSGNNSYSGGTNLNAGTIRIATDGNLGSASSAVTFNNGATTAQLVFTQSVTSNRNIVFNGTGTSARLSTEDTNLADEFFNVTTLNGTLSGAGGMDKRFVGTLVLTAPNTYQGGTVVTTGILVAGNISGSATGSGSVNVAANGRLAGNGIIAPDAGNSVTVAGRLSPGNDSAAALTFNLAPTSQLIFDTGSHLEMSVGTVSDLVAFAAPGDWLSGSGKLTLDLTLATGFDYGNNYTIFSNVTTEGFDLAGVTGYDNAQYAASFGRVGNDYVLSFTVAPEPQSWVLSVFAGIALLARLRPRHI